MALPALSVAPFLSLDAALGVTTASGKVTSWADQSGNGNDASQATVNQQPYYKNDYAGRPVVRFNSGGDSAGVAHVLSCAAATSIALKALTVFAVFRNLHVGAGTAMGIGASAFTTGFLVDDGGAAEDFKLAGKLSGIRWRLNPQLAGFRSSAAAVAMYGNYEAPAPTAAANAFTGSGLCIGGKPGGLAGHYLDLYELVAYNSGALTDADMATLKQYFTDKYSLPTVDFTRQIAFEGDSITQGVGTKDSNGWPQQLVRAANVDGWRMTDFGVSGSKVADATTRWSQYVNGYHEAGYDRNVLHVLLGRNDMGSGGLTPAQHYANMVTYCQTAVAAGWEVWVGSLIDGPAAQRANDLDYNQRLRGENGYPGIVADVPGVARVVDFAGIPELAPGGSSNLAYYNSDQTHPTEAGYALMASLMADTVAAAEIAAQLYVGAGQVAAAHLGAQAVGAMYLGSNKVL